MHASLIEIPGSNLWKGIVKVRLISKVSFNPVQHCYPFTAMPVARGDTIVVLATGLTNEKITIQWSQDAAAAKRKDY